MSLAVSFMSFLSNEQSNKRSLISEKGEKLQKLFTSCQPLIREVSMIVKYK